MAIITDPVRVGFCRNRKTNLESAPARLATVVAGVATQLIVWLERTRQRRQLFALSDRALKDFGASFAAADKEGSKPFWRA